MKYLVTFCAVMLASVLSAAPEEVRLSSFDPEKDDATAAFEAAFSSGAKKIIVDDPGFDYIVRPLFVPSDAEVVFMDKVSVRAKKEEPTEYFFCLYYTSAKKSGPKLRDFTRAHVRLIFTFIRRISPKIQQGILRLYPL